MTGSTVLPAAASRTAGRLLLAVAALFAAASLVAVPVTLGLDGTRSSTSAIRHPRAGGVPERPARARGVILLVGPVASWTDSVVVLRGYLTATAALALGLAFWPWTRVLPHPVAAPVAAGLYATLWVVLFYAGAPLPT